MVVKTRSYYSNQAAEAAESISITAPIVGRRRVRITTPSFREASTRTYKVYTPPSYKPKTRKQQKHNTTEQYHEYVCEEEDAAAAAEVLATLQEEGDGGVSFATHNICLNPLNPIEKYIYRICVYNFDRTTHLKTAYILYDSKSMLYYVYAVIRELERGNTIQLKYRAFVCDTITNYIMTLIIPSNPYDYYIQDDIIGVVSRDDAGDDFGKNIFGDESSFYDVEGFIYDKSSILTTSGCNALILMPSRHFWYSQYLSSSSSSSDDNRYYTIHTLDSAMLILSRSH